MMDTLLNPPMLSLQLQISRAPRLPEETVQAAETPASIARRSTVDLERALIARVLDTGADRHEEFWRLFESLLLPPDPRPLGGRPPLAAQKVLAGILHRLRTGCRWTTIPKDLASGATCHRWFKQWKGQGVFARLIEELDAREERLTPIRRAIPHGATSA